MTCTAVDGLAHLLFADPGATNQPQTPGHPIDNQAARLPVLHARESFDDPRRSEQHLRVGFRREFAPGSPTVKGLPAPLFVGAFDVGREVVVVVVDLIDEQMRSHVT